MVPAGTKVLMRLTWAVAALVVSVDAGGGTCDIQQVRDPETGVCFNCALGEASLVATGVRRKYSFMKIAAMGLYLKPDSTLWGKKSLSWQEVVDTAYNSVKLRLVVVTSLLTPSRLATEIRDMVEERLYVINPADAERLLGLIKTLLEGSPALPSGTEIIVHFTNTGVVIDIGPYHVEIDGTDVNKAFLACYLDDRAVERGFRTEIFKGLAKGVKLCV